MTDFFYDDKRKLYLYKTPTDLGIEGEKRLGDYTVIPYSLQNSQKLVQLGLPVRDPLADYDFPGPYKRIDAQIMTTRFMLMRPRSFILNDMRTGKTVSALWAADYVLRDYEARGEEAAALVLTTKTTIFDPWGKHVEQTFYGARTLRILVGSGDRRHSDFRTANDFYVTNYDSLKLITGSRLPDYIRIVIVDEFTAYKHATTKRFKQAYECFKGIPYLWVLSGTPAPERSIDAYGPAKLVHGLNGESYESFKNRCMYRIGGFKWLERINAKDTAARALSPAIRFTRSQVIGLPNKLPVRVINIDLSKEQESVAKELSERTLSELRGKEITAVNAAAIRLKFMQVYQGFIYDAEKKVHLLDPIHRLGALREVLEECEGRALIFSGFRGCVDMLVSAFKDMNPRFIHGDVSAKQRLRVMDEFNARKCGPIIGDPGTMGHGLDLARGASTIVWYGPVDRNEHYQQANERIEGMKQTEPTQVIHLQASKLEREIYKRLVEKQSMQMDILELVA